MIRRAPAEAEHQILTGDPAQLAAVQAQLEAHGYGASQALP